MGCQSSGVKPKSANPVTMVEGVLVHKYVIGINKEGGKNPKTILLFFREIRVAVFAFILQLKALLKFETKS